MKQNADPSRAEKVQLRELVCRLLLAGGVKFMPLG
jgi:hypothetical protein